MILLHEGRKTESDSLHLTFGRYTKTDLMVMNYQADLLLSTVFGIA